MGKGGWDVLLSKLFVVIFSWVTWRDFINKIYTTWPQGWILLLSCRLWENVRFAWLHNFNLNKSCLYMDMIWIRQEIRQEIINLRVIPCLQRPQMYSILSEEDCLAWCICSLVPQLKCLNCVFCLLVPLSSTHLSSPEEVHRQNLRGAGRTE